MPRKKRAHSRHTNTQRPSDVTEVPPEVAFARRQAQSIASVALKFAQALQNAVGARKTTPDPGPSTPLIPDISSGTVPPMDSEQEIAVISGPGTNSTSSPRQSFSSIAIALGDRVGPKLKVKIWANEYVDSGCLLSLRPSTERYSLSLAPSGTSSAQPQLNLEPVHAAKKIHSLNQWLTAFNTFVAIYVEKYPSDATRLMKYCEVVRDIASKPGDWLFYDEQFRYIRQSAPVSYPWDTIYWTDISKESLLGFSGREVCGGCRFPHVCFKCGSPHPASQCARLASPRPPVQPGNKQSPSAHPPVHQSGNPHKGGQA